MTPYRCLIEEGPLTVVDLLHFTHMSFKELNEEIDRLLAKDWIEIVHRGPKVPLVQVKGEKS